MEYHNNLPIYVQIKDFIKKDIVKKKILLGEKLPSTREMALKLKVNPNTIARVYKELEQEKITFTKRGLGTFITEEEVILNELKNIMANKIIKDFFNGMYDLGYSKEEILEMLK